MRGYRVLALLLAMALLWTATCALGEEMNIELTDEALQIEVEDIEVEGGDALSLDLPEALELPGEELGEALSMAEATEAASNGDGALVGYYQPGSGADNDALFAGYVDGLFGRPVPKKNGYVGDRLKGNAATAYKKLLKLIQKVAAGTQSSTRLSFTLNVNSTSEIYAVFDVMGTVIDALLTDCAYDLYWYDKTSYTEYGYDNGAFYVNMPVAREYAKSTYVTRASKIQSAQTAAANAKKVVKQYAGVSDYKKLCAYRDYICKAVTYYDAAAEDQSMPYGNPWQVIWVFDGNSRTNVVCEGYAKAFQYLCDLSAFKGKVQSHVVSGIAGGPHMWNLVTMEDGKNYHVDITAVDSGYDEAFLAGATASNSDYYVIADQIAYAFDWDTLNTYAASVLKVASRDYNPNPVKPTGITITQGDSATLYMGNTLTLKTQLKPGNATTTLTWSSSNKNVATVSSKGVVTPKKGGTVKITAKTANNKSATITVRVVDAKSVTLTQGGNALKEGKSYSLKRGKSVTLGAKVSPAKVKTKLTWKSSDKYVTVKDGKVTVNSKAKVGTKAKITVTTANGRSTYIYVNVK